jgi:hypothetical protein
MLVRNDHLHYPYGSAHQAEEWNHSQWSFGCSHHARQAYHLNEYVYHVIKDNRIQIRKW